MALRAEWVPRLQNEEADALTKFDFRHFKTKNRIDVSLESLRFAVEGYLAEVEAAKIAYKKQRAGEPKSFARRKRKGEGLCETYPRPA